jgi:dienelactone hydrolase
MRTLLVLTHIFFVWNTSNNYLLTSRHTGVALAWKKNNNYHIKKTTQPIATQRKTTAFQHISKLLKLQLSIKIPTDTHCIRPIVFQQTILNLSKDNALIDNNQHSKVLLQNQQQQEQARINNRNISIPSAIKKMKRSTFLINLVTIGVLQLFFNNDPVLAFQVVGGGYQSTTTTKFSISSTNNNNEPITAKTVSVPTTVSTTILYRSLSLPIPKFGITVPVAAWFPLENNNDNDDNPNIISSLPIATYKHRISVRKIGQLLAKWDWIPEFVSKEYNMDPTGIASISSSSSSSTIKVLSGETIPLHSSTKQYPIIILAHGFLGSRFDLSHLAEELASQGFICIAAEYPESLAASYDTTTNSSTTFEEEEEPLTRSYITTELLRTMDEQWNIIQHDTKSRKFGIIGHSLGTGTVFTTGDDTWVRVCLAGYPSERFRQQSSSNKIPDALFISSMNDGLVSRFDNGKESFKQSFVQESFQLINENDILQVQEQQEQYYLPSRTAIVFDRDNAPNHISFLAGSVNDAMIEFLSPLLPVAQVLNIPVLDFDKYKISQDSIPTAAVVHPIIVKYLKQEMKLL